MTDSKCNMSTLISIVRLNYLPLGLEFGESDATGIAAEFDCETAS